MSEFSYRNNTLHRRLTCFVNWVRPNDDTITDINDRANQIRKRVKSKAEDEGLTVTATPHSGSFAKSTGLRRHMRGHSEVEGQDIDIPFVVAPKTTDGEKLDELLDRFYDYAEAAYPDTKKEKTKSSIRLFFADKVSYDLVPMLSTGKANEEIIIRANGDRIKTSIEKHVDFICSRTKASRALPGRVQFNECVRLMKWWREVQSVDGYYLGPDKSKMPSSMLIDLLCAKAYDELSVCTTYAETLARWFAYLANTAKNRRYVFFTDYVVTRPASESGVEWYVHDPINAKNNVIHKWGANEASELTDWLVKGRDEWARAQRFNEDGENAKSKEAMVKIFGTAFNHHCD